MNGVIFTELVSFLETVHGVAFADAVISESRLPNDGAFTSVGNYPSAQALQQGSYTRESLLQAKPPQHHPRTSLARSRPLRQGCR